MVAVVDDDEAVGRALRRLLRSAGFDVATYVSAAVFLGSLVHHPPDCVVLDLHMPVIDGVQVLQYLNELGSRVPVFIITGYDSPGARQVTSAAGAAGYFTKPVDGESLIEAVQGAVARSAT